MIDETDLAELTEAKSTLAVPRGWRRTATGEVMPNVVAAIRSSRAGR